MLCYVGLDGLRLLLLLLPLRGSSGLIWCWPLMIASLPQPLPFLLSPTRSLAVVMATWRQLRTCTAAAASVKTCWHDEMSRLQRSAAADSRSSTLWPKKQTRVIWNTLYSLSRMQLNLARNILMSLAIKRIHNLPPRLTYVSTLPDITQNRKLTLSSSQKCEWR